jgi:protein-tyrosine-phosphatase
MAEALFTAAGTGATSARNAPAEHVHPEVVEIMRKVGVDLHRVPSRLEDADAEWADLVVTMCCGDSCPYIPGKRYIDSELTIVVTPLDALHTMPPRPSWAAVRLSHRGVEHRRQKLAVCRDFKPSDGLEPWTPSLP